MSPLMLAVCGLLVAFDFQNVLSWWHGKVVSPGEEESYDFTVVIPLFGHPRYFEGREAIAKYRDNVLVALEVTPPIMRAFADELEAEGWGVCRIELADPNPASLMAAALPSVRTGYTLRLDADTHLGDGLEQIVAAVAASGADLCSTKIEAENLTTVPAKLQALEYRMAMLSRHFRPWLTSGACFIAKTDSLRLIFAQHSHWTPGEDIETGRTALTLKLKVRHADFVVTTDVPDTWRGLVKQRRLWWAGAFRHWFVNADRNALHLPVVTAYTVLAVFASVYFKWWGMVDIRKIPTELPIVLAVYTFVTFVTNLQVRSRWMLIFPLYSLVQGMVMPLVGAIYYVALARKFGTLGRYRFGYRRGTPAGALEQLRLERLALADAVSSP